MPWEKQFDVNSALDRAMEAFWSAGYQATSTQTLLDRMKINRGSLYDTFGSKRALFITALKRYEETYQRPKLAVAGRGRTPRETIGALFQGLVAEASSSTGRHGCLMVNTALELAAHDTEIADIVAASLGATRKFFADNIRAGQELGEIKDDLDVAGVSDALLGMLVGIRVMARSMPDVAMLNGIAAQAQALLG